MAAEGCGNSHKLASDMQQQTEAEVRLSILGLRSAWWKPNCAEPIVG